MENKQIRIFIAEDIPLVLNGYKTILAKNGYTVCGEAYDGESAIKGILETRPDIALMDIYMPVMDGLATVEKISEQYEMPYIIITGYNDTELVNRANRGHVFGYLLKPVDESELISTIQVTIHRFQEMKALKEENLALKKSLEDRKIIERAKGILMDDMGMKEQQAMEYLQKKSREKNIKMVEIAKKIISVNE